MDQEQAFARCVEIYECVEGLGKLGKSFVELVQDSPLGSSEEDALIAQFRATALELKDLFYQVKTTYIGLIHDLD